MSSLISEFQYSPKLERLKMRPFYTVASKLVEKEASWGHEFRKGQQFRVKEYYRDGRIERPDPNLVPVDQGTQYRSINLEHEGKVVATVTLYFPKRNQVWGIIENATRNEGQWKAFFYERIDQSIEIKNLVIHPEFRGTDVIMRIFEIIHRELVRSRRKYIVTSCVSNLISKYLNIAFKETKLSYTRDYGRRETLHLLYSCQFKYGGYGLHVGPLKWAIYLSKISKDLRAEYPHGILQRLVLRCYSLLAPFFMALFKIQIYFRWFQWQNKQRDSRRISYVRFFRMLTSL